MFDRIKFAVDRWYRQNMPGFWLRLKPRYQWAGGILIVVFAWVASGLIFHGGSTADTSDAQAKTTGDAALVRVTALTATPHDATITVRGRTQALHAVDVRAEVEGVVKAIHFDKGQKVKTGDVLCEIDINDRGAKVAQMRAMVAQTGKELEIAQELYKEGFRSKTQLAQAQAANEGAKAGASTMGIQLANTRIKAPFDGFVDDRYVDVGDYMRIGDKCEMVIAPEPFLAVGTVTEHEVGQIVIGAAADAKLRDGVSADIHIPVKRLNAVKISPGILVLDDSGVVGVRLVENGIVRFHPIQILSDGPDGMWIAGLPDRANVITVGQEFVTEGTRVKAVYDKSGTSL